MKTFHKCIWKNLGSSKFNFQIIFMKKTNIVEKKFKVKSYFQPDFN